MSEEWAKFGREKMGEIVEVHAVCKGMKDFRDNVEYRKLKRLALQEPRAGWVMGYRDLQKGKINRHIYEEPEFVPMSRVRVVEVVFWPTMNPVHVHPMDLVYPTILEPETSEARSMRRWKEQWPAQYEEWCKQMREHMESMPRDDQGRIKANRG